MKKEYWEVLSIALETAAFFLAAPDFLGERVLRNIGRMFDGFLRPIGLEAATVARDLRGIVTIGWGRPWPRIWQIAIVLLADVCLIASWWFDWHPLAGLMRGTMMDNPLAGWFFFGVLNLTVLCYVVEMLVVSATGNANGKGALFLVGSILFITSKSIAILVALEKVGGV
jgi:hypothetical protein